VSIVIAHNHGAGRAGAQAGQRGGEERRGGLAHHVRLGAGGLFQAREERAGIELQALAGAPVQAAVHGDQPGSALQVAEGLVQCLIAELRAGPADQHHVRRRLVVFLGEGQAGQVPGDVSAVEQQAPGARVAVVQVGGGDDRRGEDFAGGDREARPASTLAIETRVREVVLVTRPAGPRRCAAGAGPRPPRAAVSTTRSARHRCRSAPRACADHNRSRHVGPRYPQLPAGQA
jgi:hypothetical protein